jgi:hypothetical protein
VGPSAVLDAVVERKIPSPRGESSPRTPLSLNVRPIEDEQLKKDEIVR